jgi:trans-aconitate 2-methyltransferase
MRDIASSQLWRSRFPEGGVREWYVHHLPFYYDVLAPLVQNVNLWETEYIHVMPDAGAIVEWYKGTGMRPFLDSLPSAGDRERFTFQYLNEIRAAYPAHADGRVLFPFRRLFAIANVD